MTATRRWEMAVASGQNCVCYRGDQVLGGAAIAGSLTGLGGRARTLEAIGLPV